jgi:hypothetical protein
MSREVHFEFYKKLKNEVVLLDGKPRDLLGIGALIGLGSCKIGVSVYHAEAYDLQFDGVGSVCGRVKITKFELRGKEVVIAGTIFPDITPNTIETEIWKKKKWSFNVRKRRCFFLLDGKSLSSKEEGYRRQLAIAAARKGILFADSLLNEVFGPIDKKIEEAYKKTLIEKCQ